jgi:hypothetical protein
MGLFGLFSSPKKAQPRDRIIFNLKEIEEGFRGKPFNQLIAHHLRSQSRRQRREGMFGTIAQMPKQVQPTIEHWIDKWNCSLYNYEFWREDTSEIFNRIIQDARAYLHENNYSTYDDELLFNMFNIVVLNYAYTAEDQRAMREFIGIK